MDEKNNMQNWRPQFLAISEKGKASSYGIWEDVMITELNSNKQSCARNADGTFEHHLPDPVHGVDYGRIWRYVSL